MSKIRSNINEVRKTGIRVRAQSGKSFDTWQERGAYGS